MKTFKQYYKLYLIEYYIMRVGIFFFFMVLGIIAMILNQNNLTLFDYFFMFLYIFAISILAQILVFTLNYDSKFDIFEEYEKYKKKCHKKYLFKKRLKRKLENEN